MRLRLAIGEKPLDWVGSAKEDFLAFPLRSRKSRRAGEEPRAPISK
jgi:phage-related protein